MFSAGSSATSYHGTIIACILIKTDMMVGWIAGIRPQGLWRIMSDRVRDLKVELPRDLGEGMPRGGKEGWNIRLDARL